MDDLRQQALAYLQQHRVMTLATVGSEGVWGAALFYVNKEFDLFFLSAGHTRHAQNMKVNPRTAVTIQEDYTDWSAIQGIQLEGLVEQLHSQERRDAIQLYRSKFPFMVKAKLPIRAALTKVNWYRLTPVRFYFIDNSKGFGHRDFVSCKP